MLLLTSAFGGHKPAVVFRDPRDGNSDGACDFKLILCTAVTCVTEQLGGHGVLIDGRAQRA